MLHTVRNLRIPANRTMLGGTAFSVFAILFAGAISIFFGMMSHMADRPDVSIFGAELAFWVFYAAGGFVIGSAFPRAWGFSVLVPSITILTHMSSGFDYITRFADSNVQAWLIIFNTTFGTAFVALFAGYLGSRVGKRYPRVKKPSE